MSSTLAKWKSRDFLVVILFLQFIVYATVFFDVPVARQAIGFLYFTFIPRIIIVKLLKLNELDGGNCSFLGGTKYRFPHAWWTFY